MARVLIYEHDEGVRLLLEAQVKALGHEPLLLDKADEGWSATRFDVAVIEPEAWAALQLARRLRHQRPEVPLVFVSIRERTPETTELDAVDHLLKPFRLAALDEALDEALRRSKDVESRRSRREEPLPAH